MFNKETNYKPIGFSEVTNYIFTLENEFYPISYYESKSNMNYYYFKDHDFIKNNKNISHTYYIVNNEMKNNIQYILNLYKNCSYITIKIKCCLLFNEKFFKNYYYNTLKNYINKNEYINKDFQSFGINIYKYISNKYMYVFINSKEPFSMNLGQGYVEIDKFFYELYKNEYINNLIEINEKFNNIKTVSDLVKLEFNLCINLKKDNDLVRLLTKK